MNRGFSIYLDALRFLAALAVFVSHLAYARFTNGNLQWIRDINLGSDAVVVFFVLSGYVIAYTTFARDRGPAAYAESRIARLYSVVIPALLLTFALDTFGASLQPQTYEAAWYNGENRIGQFIGALTFSTQAWSSNVNVGSNGPFWSVAYEAWYYVGFGVAVFCRGPMRLVLLALIALIVGPPILLLAPCWLLGVGLERALRRDHMAALPKAAAWALALAPWALYAGGLALHVPGHLTALTDAVLHRLALPDYVLGFSDEFIWNFLIAVLMATHFIGVYRLAQEATWIGARAATAIRWLAGATFSVYLFHYPVLNFLHGLPAFDNANPVHQLALAAVALAACFLLAEVSERRLPFWKRLVGRLLGRLATNRPEAPAPQA